MKVAVSSSGKDLDSQIDPRFGRCAYFLIVETDDISFEVFENENVALGGGAGIQSAQFVASMGARAVITGNCGPNAVDTLAAAGVELFAGQSGTIREAIEKYKKGGLRPTREANVTSHYGTGGPGATGGSQSRSFGGRISTGRGMGGGRGLGRGMGMGCGRGMGRGRGMGPGMGMSAWNLSNDTSSADSTRDQELRALKEQAKNLKNQMREIEARIKNLEKND
jgi:predicted Fe-Mo cluster-binding NifX family protein